MRGLSVFFQSAVLTLPCVLVSTEFCSLTVNSQTLLIPPKPLIFKAPASWSVAFEWPSLNTTQARVKHLSGLGNHDYLLVADFKHDILQPCWNTSSKTNPPCHHLWTVFYFYREYPYKRHPFISWHHLIFRERSVSELLNTTQFTQLIILAVCLLKMRNDLMLLP